MKAPNKIYVEVCEDGIFAFPKPPFKESVEYIRAELVEQPLPQEQPEVELKKEIKGYFMNSSYNLSSYECWTIASHFYELGLKARKEESK